MTKRLDSLDALRGVAALLVVLVHLPLALGVERGYERLTEILGRAGVVAFWLLSGYVVSRSLQIDPHLGRFWIKRLCRLYPLYWASVITAALLGALHVLPDLPYYPGRGAWVALVNLTMLQHAVGIKNLLAVYWTLYMELIGYGTLWLAARFRIGARFPLLVLGTVLLFCVSLITFLPDPLVLYGVLVVLLGALVATAQREAAARPPALISGLLAVAVLAWTDRPAVPGFVLGAAAFAVALQLRRSPAPRVLLWLGQRSYSFYLGHQLVYAVLPQTGPLVVRTVLAVAGVLLLAAGTERWIERPGIALGRRLAKRVDRRPEPWAAQLVAVGGDETGAGGVVV